MKKLIAILLFLFQIGMLNASGNTSRLDVILKPNVPTSNRDIVGIPEAKYDSEDGSLQLTVKSEKLCTVEVLDETGESMYQTAVVADGDAHVYSLPLLVDSNHTIVVESGNSVYSGEINQ